MKIKNVIQGYRVCPSLLTILAITALVGSLSMDAQDLDMDGAKYRALAELDAKKKAEVAKREADVRAGKIPDKAYYKSDLTGNIIPVNPNDPPYTGTNGEVIVSTKSLNRGQQYQLVE